jgi:hypothetical protein
MRWGEVRGQTDKGLGYGLGYRQKKARTSGLKKLYRINFLLKLFNLIASI